MKTAILAAAAAAAFVGATSAHATSGVVGSSFDDVTGTFSDRGFSVGGFDDTYVFTNTPSGEYNISISTSTKGVTFSTITFDGTTVPFSNAFESGLLQDFSVGAGPQTLVVEGSYSGANGKTGSYDGTVQFTASAAPEPSAWMLMIAGVALTGGALRYGRRGWASAAA